MIKRKHVIAQLKYDLIGKDSQRGVTLTYSWMANQFGHFGLGFIPTALIYLAWEYDRSQGLLMRPFLYVLGFWTLFETYNYIKGLVRSTANSAFRAAWKNVLADTALDVMFFGFGAASAGYAFTHSQTLLYIMLAFGAIVLLPTPYWFKVKMFQQEARFPFQFRLSQWSKNISEENKKVIEEFVAFKGTGKHLLVFGANRSGKTTLSVGMANEKAIEKKKVLYTTAIELYSAFTMVDPERDQRGSIWEWRDADFLIIDDVNPELVPPVELVQPTDFFRFLKEGHSMGKINIEALKRTNTIWVLGYDNPFREMLNKWELALRNEGITDVTSVFLD